MGRGNIWVTQDHLNWAGERGSKYVLEDLFFELPRRIGAPGGKREFWPGAIFQFLTPKGGPKAAKERLRTPQGGPK